MEKLATVLRGAGIDVTVTADVRAALFAKLLFVEPFGSVGAVTRSSIDVVRAIPEARALLEGAMEEVRAVAEGLGVRLREGEVGAALARVDAAPVGAMASMHRALVEGRRSELEEQTGAVRAAPGGARGGRAAGA